MNMITDICSDSKAALQKIVEEASNKKKIVFISGNFNILHPGHLRLLRYGSEVGDFLVVGVVSDSLTPTIFSENIRLESVQETSWVDHAFILQDSPEAFIEYLKPAVVVKGKEHEHSFNPEQEIVQKYGGRIDFCSGDVAFSSIDLLRKQIENVNHSGISLPDDFLLRHQIKISNLKNYLHKFNQLKVCVIGDSIVDEYIDCEPLGMSQEDPTVVVAPLNNEQFIGGAAIVAAHASSLGASVTFFSPIGDDETAKYLENKLEAYNVKAHLFHEEGRPTTVKQRYRASGKTLLRVNHLRQHSISESTQEKIKSSLFPIIDKSHLVLFSDFNYGALPQSLIDSIQEYCLSKQVMMVADCQCSSQVGDITKFQNMALITPTEREARLAMRDYDSGLVILGRKICDKKHVKNIIITLREEGALIYSSDEKHAALHTDKLPAFNESPKDTAGAGDSLLTVASMVLASNGEIWEAAYLGSVAAACQTSRMGNIPLKPIELIKELDKAQTIL